MRKPLPRFQAVIFDMDGTITEPVFDFDAIRREVFAATGCTGELETFPPEQRQVAWEIIMRHEQHAAANQMLKTGTRALLESCRAADIPVGLLTLNCRRHVDALVQKFDLAFDCIITREHANPKPHPAPVHEMTQRWQVAPQQTLLVGDYIHDIQCGRQAGTVTCFFQNPGCKDFSRASDITVKSMQELHHVVFA